MVYACRPLGGRTRNFHVREKVVKRGTDYGNRPFNRQASVTRLMAMVYAAVR